MMHYVLLCSEETDENCKTALHCKMSEEEALDALDWVTGANDGRRKCWGAHFVAPIVNGVVAADEHCAYWHASDGYFKTDPKSPLHHDNRCQSCKKEI